VGYFKIASSFFNKLIWLLTEQLLALPRLRSFSIGVTAWLLFVQEVIPVGKKFKVVQGFNR
jgi:hypothetical protein